MILLQTTIFGNTIEAYLVAAFILLLSVIIAVLANRILRRVILSWARRTQTELDDLVVRRVLTPLSYFVIIAGLSASKGHLELSETLTLWLDRLLLVLTLSLFFYMFIRFLQGLIEVVSEEYCKRLKRKRPPDLEEQIKTVDRIKKQIREISTMVLALMAVLTILSNLGVDLKAIWASLGIGGIALVVAVQEPLRNLVGRLYIFSTGIFDEGHFIVFNQWAGTVKRIAMFRTYLELFSDMTTVSIPNAEFVRGVVKTYYGRTKFMYKWDLDVPYDIPPPRIQELIVRLRELILSKPEVNPQMCWIYLERLDRYSKVVRVWFQVNLSDWATSLFYGNQVLHDIQLLFEEMNIPFAFPTQELRIRSENPWEGVSTEVPAALPTEEGKKSPSS
jgi:MscS family membrane protein